MTAYVLTVMDATKKNTSVRANVVSHVTRKRMNASVLDVEDVMKRNMSAFVNVVMSVQKKSLSVLAVKYC